MTKLVYKENAESWHIVDEPLQLEHPMPFPSSKPLYKMLDFFAAGEYGYATVSAKLGVIETSCERLVAILGIETPRKLSEFSGISLKPSVNELLERKSFDFFESLPKCDLKLYKARFDYSIKHSLKGKRRILQQISPLVMKEDGAIQNYLFIFTDITYIKRSGATRFAIVNKELGETVKPTISFGQPINNPFSKREREILTCLLDKLSPKHIAKKYNLSIHTVYNHKKSMRRKSNCNSSIDMVVKAIKNGWV